MKKRRISEAIREAYKRGENEETMEPIVQVDEEGKPIGRIAHGDQIIFYDIRGEREIELTQAFTDPDFSEFPIRQNLKTGWATMVMYHKDLNVDVAFPPIDVIRDTVSEVISKAGLKQAKIAETEKAVHVGYFFTGKTRDPFPKEERFHVDSPEGAGNYETTPDMNAAGVTEKTIEQIEDPDVRFLTVNYCNVDVLGHTENKPAILRALNTVDTETGKLLQKAREHHFTVLITADHGTVERYLYPEGAIDTGHTISDVPFICVSEEDLGTVRKSGGLIDVAPTVLDLFNLNCPKSMQGKSLFEKSLPINPDRRVMLVILDGWGFNPDDFGNLVKEADTPNYDWWMQHCPNSLLRAAGESVGLPENTVGNSEVGHLHLGSGRIVPSDKVRIKNDMENGLFNRNPAFLKAMRKAKEARTALHLLGIISFFSSHGSIDYALALLRMAKEVGVEKVYVHGLLGRRGERPESGAYYTKKIEDEAERLGVGEVVSVIGRHWALDREYNWDRIEKTYRMLVYGDGVRV